MKTHKSISKRVKLTKGGKLMKIKNGRDHFNSRDAGKITRSKRRGMQIAGTFERSMKRLIGV